MGWRNNQRFCQQLKSFSSKSPHFPVSAKIEEQIINLDNDKEVITILKSIKSNAGKIISSSLPTMIKIASHGLLDFKGDQAIEEAISDYLSTLPNEYTKYKKERESLRKSLIKFSKKISGTKSGVKNNKIVFFIDELDRCRPTFAINLLEKIKHIFNLTGYAFILAVDKEQLGYSLKTLYGKDMDTEGYLRRFIDFNYNLDDSKTLNFIPLLFKNLGYSGLFEGSHLESFREKFFLEMLKAYCKSFALSLRDTEQLFFHLKIVLPQINCEVLHNLYTVPLLLVLRLKNYGVYSDYINRNRDATEIINLIEDNKELESFFETKPHDHIKIKLIGYLRLLAATTPEDFVLLEKYLLEQKKQNESITVYDDLLNLLPSSKQNKFLDELKSIIEFTFSIT